MVFVILDIVTSNCMAILIQIGLEVIQTEKALWDIDSIGVIHDFEAKQEAIQYCSQYDRNRVHCSILHQL